MLGHKINPNKIKNVCTLLRRVNTLKHLCNNNRTINSFIKRNENVTSNIPFCRRAHNIKNKHKIDDGRLIINGFTIRTHTCGELRPKNVGERVVICGWVQYSRLSKFLLLRDAYGLTQCIVGSDDTDLSSLQLESVVQIEGMVSIRPRDTVNHEMATGEIEVTIIKLKVLNPSEKVAFNLRNYQKPKEQLRMQHRYIALRFPEMQNNLRTRSQMLHKMRRFLVENYGFIEVETPTLFCRTPGGAREFVVPTRHKGLFYSLVQSPQQFKQMLMSGGIDRYFQVARCYRDETTRPDRQPEFTQLDIELSFTTLEGVLTLIEEMLYDTFTKPLPRPPFNRITYKEALENYGSDKPNLLYDLKFINIKHLFDKKENDNFGAFLLPYPSEMGKLTTKYKEKVKDIAKKYNAKVVFNENISKEYTSDLQERIQDAIGQNRAAIISISEDTENACLCLGEIKDMIISVLKSKELLKVNDNVAPLWVIDFPLFVKGDDGLQPCHHPFTAPHPDDLHLLETEPLKVRSLAYDLVMNGNEIGGGSVRIHSPHLQVKIMKMLNIDPEKLRHFVNALSSGCPPHAGIALGIDRLMAIVCDAESIRDVIAFPKSHDGRDPLSGAPNVLSHSDRNYYHLNHIK
ncbi:aspartate--tRNA ligase, mitochondrial [Bombyx mori]|uniref:Aminoacyl-transfer RNA synthetases class-II family profile domain-containing protein n=1 Tax=Bombyx mori TaxID=7091 RepID=A0A8R2M4V9_BOMMO|nr:aspartate--tRNA ligase, mitochondrial [Bombyx mori]